MDDEPLPSHRGGDVPQRRPELVEGALRQAPGKLWSKNGIHFILRNEVYTGALVWGARTGALVWGARTGKDQPVRVDKAFPAIVSKTRFRSVNRLMRSRASRVAHPRKVGSAYLLSGLVKCKACNRALSGQDAKIGKFATTVASALR